MFPIDEVTTVAVYGHLRPIKETHLYLIDLINAAGDSRLCGSVDARRRPDHNRLLHYRSA